MNRRTFLKASVSASAAATLGFAAQDYEQPLFNLHKFFPNPVRVASIDLLQSGKTFFVRTRSSDGVEGVIQTKDMEDFIPILHRRVIPHFVGKDARDLETLVDAVYIANYKLSGQALWCPVAYVEQSLFDLLGKTAKKQAAELMGGVDFKTAADCAHAGANSFISGTTLFHLRSMKAGVKKMRKIAEDASPESRKR
jgi:L-alanine-DL-glutamate epimerase-like enolase superfamily enzyme